MARFVFDCVLRLVLGPADREFEARITYQGGRWQADVEAVEVLISGGGWMPCPDLRQLVQDDPDLCDALRDHACGVMIAARADAAALRR